MRTCLCTSTSLLLLVHPTARRLGQPTRSREAPQLEDGVSHISWFRFSSDSLRAHRRLALCGASARLTRGTTSWCPRRLFLHPHPSWVLISAHISLQTCALELYPPDKIAPWASSPRYYARSFATCVAAPKSRRAPNNVLPHNTDQASQ